MIRRIKRKSRGRKNRAEEKRRKMMRKKDGRMDKGITMK